MSKILVVTYCLPDDYAQWVFSKDPVPGIQSNTFSHSLVRAFENSGYAIEVISSAPVQDYPVCPIASLPQATMEFQSARGFVFASSNKPLRKRFGRLFSVLCYSFRCKPNVVVFHGLYFPYLVVGAILRVFGYETCLVLTDPSGVRLNSDGVVRASLKKIEAKITRLLTRTFKYGIALSQSLNERYMPGRKSLVVPGIFPGISGPVGGARKEEVARTTTESLRVGYFGGVFPGYGVVEFADLISKSDLDIEFDIYGVGS